MHRIKFATVLGSGNLYISAKDVHHLVVNMRRAIVETISIMHCMTICPLVMKNVLCY